MPKPPRFEIRKEADDEYHVWDNLHNVVVRIAQTEENAKQEISLLLELYAKNSPDKEHSDGSTASYYELPASATELQHLISFKDMNAQIGEIFRACYRYNQVAHSDARRDIKKIIFYANAELERLEKYGN